jgi:hypothetical protein
MDDTPYYVAFDQNIAGIPRKSLKLLRDTLSNSITRMVAVVEVPTGGIHCGYLILDKDSKKATWTGDNFKKGAEVELESGYKSAEAILLLFGIKPVRWKVVGLDEVNFFPERKAREILIGLVQEVVKEISGSDFYRPIDEEPDFLP